MSCAGTGSPLQTGTGQQTPPGSRELVRKALQGTLCCAETNGASGGGLGFLYSSCKLHLCKESCEMLNVQLNMVQAWLNRSGRHWWLKQSSLRRLRADAGPGPLQHRGTPVIVPKSHRLWTRLRESPGSQGREGVGFPSATSCWPICFFSSILSLCLLNSPFSSSPSHSALMLIPFLAGGTGDVTY